MTPKQNEAISESLGLAPLPDKKATSNTAIVPQVPTTVIENDAALEDDFTTARNNLRNLAEKTQDIIDDLRDLAMESENPKHFESLAAFIKNATEMNKELVTLSKTRKEAHKLAGRGTDPQPAENPQQITVQNALFVGSTNDITALIEQERKKQEKKVIDVSVNTDSNDQEQS